MKKTIAVIVVLIMLICMIHINAEETELLDINISKNSCSDLNENSTYDPENRVLTLAPGTYGEINCDNDLTVKTLGKTQIYQIKAEKTFGSSTLKIVDASIATNPDKLGSKIICNGDIEITNSSVEVDYFIVTETGKIDIENSSITIAGISKMQGYIFAGGNIYIRNSTVLADYNINTYGSLTIENSTVTLPSKYSNGGYITAPLGALIKKSNLDIFYYINCDNGDFKALDSTIKVSLNRPDNKRRSNIETGNGNITIAYCNIEVDAYLKCNIGDISIQNSTLDVGSLVCWNGNISLNRVSGNINGAKSINSDSTTGIFGKKIQLSNIVLPDSYVIGKARIGENDFATITLSSGEMAYGFKLKTESTSPVVWILIIAAIAIISIVFIVVMVKISKKKKVSE